MQCWRTGHSSTAQRTLVQAAAATPVKHHAFVLLHYVANSTPITLYSGSSPMLCTHHARAAQVPAGHQQGSGPNSAATGHSKRLEIVTAMENVPRPALRRYPLAIIKDLDPRRPNAARLLGIPVVMWRDGSGAWRAFEDRCPHRCAAACGAAYSTQELVGRKQGACGCRCL